MGYVPQLSVAVWMGNDNYRPMSYGATGGTIVAPVWRDFMSQALEGVPAESFKPASSFERP